jgi:hypothetical protein
MRDRDGMVGPFRRLPMDQFVPDTDRRCRTVTGPSPLAK